MAEGVKIEDLSPYREYQDSGSRWLGPAPSHWEVRNLRTLIRPRNERNRPDLPLLSVAREKGVFVRSLTDDDNHNVIPEDLSNYKVAKAGDLVINKMKAWQGSMGIAPCDGIVSPAYYVFRFAMASPRFGQALLRSKPYVAHFGQASDGVRVGQWDLSIPGMREIPVLIPPPDEQDAIVRFLGWATSRLDLAIRAKRKVIALLNEQKLVIIHRAVTRGLDSSVPLKHSGVSWIGTIPKHWEIWRISHFARVGNGSTPSRAQSNYWSGGGYPWLNSSQINRGYIDSADQFVTPMALRECHLPRVPAGSVLVAITGQGKTRGMSAVLEIEATINQHIAYLSPRTPVASPEFIQLALTASYSHLRAISDDSGSTKGALTCEDLKRFKLPIPPREEQDALLKSIQTETGALNTSISRLESEVTLLLEYRSRLVSDVVTGKLDVRKAALNLPNEGPSEASEAMDPGRDESEFEEEEIQA